MKDLQKRPLGFGIQSDSINSEKQAEVALPEFGVFRDHVDLWGTGSPLREFMYSADLADAVVHLMLNYDYAQVGELVNIGVRQDLTIKALAQKIAALVGYNGFIQFDPSNPDGTPRKLLDVSKIRSLGWSAKTSLDEGLIRLYEWYTSG